MLAHHYPCHDPLCSDRTLESSRCGGVSLDNCVAIIKIIILLLILLCSGSFYYKIILIKYPADSEAQGHRSSNGLVAADMHAGHVYYSIHGLAPFEHRTKG